jgi:hypothetical protein
MKRLYLFIVLGLFIANIHAQNYLDLVKFSYSNTHSNKFLNSAEKTSIEEFKLQLNFPVVLDQKNTLLTGLNSKKFRLQLDPDLAENFNFYFIGLELGIHQVYSEKWAATYFLFPGIASDLHTISKRDYQIGLLALFNYTKRKNLRYKFGLYGHTELYGPLIVPLLGLYYTSTNQQWEFDLNLPIMVEINYNISNNLTIGTNFDGLGSTYNFNKSFSISENPYLAKTSNELFAFSRFQLDKSIFLKISAGYSFFRTFKIYDKNDKVDLSVASIYLGDERKPLNTKFKDGAIFKLELIYRIHFD